MHYWRLAPPISPRKLSYACSIGFVFGHLCTIIEGHSEYISGTEIIKVPTKATNSI